MTHGWQGGGHRVGIPFMAPEPPAPVPSAPGHEGQAAHGPHDVSATKVRGETEGKPIRAKRNGNGEKKKEEGASVHHTTACHIGEVHAREGWEAVGGGGHQSPATPQEGGRGDGEGADPGTTTQSLEGGGGTPPPPPAPTQQSLHGPVLQATRGQSVRLLTTSDSICKRSPKMTPPH